MNTKIPFGVQGCAAGEMKITSIDLKLDQRYQWRNRRAGGTVHPPGGIYRAGQAIIYT